MTMNKYSSYILEELKKRQISIRNLSELTGIDYMALYYSLSDKRDRIFRVDEYMQICAVLEINPIC